MNFQIADEVFIKRSDRNFFYQYLIHYFYLKESVQLESIFAVGEKTVHVKWLENEQIVAKDLKKEDVVEHFPKSRWEYFSQLHLKHFFQFSFVLFGTFHSFPDM